jgi:hypothetical protein
MLRMLSFSELHTFPPQIWIAMKKHTMCTEFEFVHFFFVYIFQIVFSLSMVIHIKKTWGVDDAACSRELKGSKEWSKIFFFLKFNINFVFVFYFIFFSSHEQIFEFIENKCQTINKFTICIFFYYSYHIIEIWNWLYVKMFHKCDCFD